MNNINTTKKIKLLDGSTIEIDFSKVQVVSTKMEDRHKFTFPKEGWFVGASNCGGGLNGQDSFKIAYLYRPSWIKSRQEWGGYLSHYNGIFQHWWTYNYVSSNICTDYLYFCDDKQTSQSLASLLNSCPSKNIKAIQSDIKAMSRKLNDILGNIKLLRDIDRTCSQLLTTAI